MSGATTSKNNETKQAQVGIGAAAHLEVQVTEVQTAETKGSHMKTKNIKSSAVSLKMSVLAFVACAGLTVGLLGASA
jgi:hypothetical protein